MTYLKDTGAYVPKPATAAQKELMNESAAKGSRPKRGNRGAKSIQSNDVNN